MTQKAISAFFFAGGLLYWIPHEGVDYFVDNFLAKTLLLNLVSPVAVLAGLGYLNRRFPQPAAALALCVLFGILLFTPVAFAIREVVNGWETPVSAVEDLVGNPSQLGDVFLVKVLDSWGGLVICTFSLIGVSLFQGWKQLRARFPVFARVTWRMVEAAGVITVALIVGWWIFIEYEVFRHDQLTFEVVPSCGAGADNREIGDLDRAFVSQEWAGEQLVLRVSDVTVCGYTTERVSAQVVGSRMYLKLKYSPRDGMSAACLCRHTTLIRVDGLNGREYVASVVRWP